MNLTANSANAGEERSAGNGHCRVDDRAVDDERAALTVLGPL
jgi:hypothetical protein